MVRKIRDPQERSLVRKSEIEAIAFFRDPGQAAIKYAGSSKTFQAQSPLNLCWRLYSCKRRGN